MVGITKDDVMDELRKGSISRPALNQTMLEAIETCICTLTLLEHQADVKVMRNLLLHWLFKNADVLQPLLERRNGLLLDIKENAASEEAAG